MKNRFSASQPNQKHPVLDHLATIQLFAPKQSSCEKNLLQAQCCEPLPLLGVVETGLCGELHKERQEDGSENVSNDRSLENFPRANEMGNSVVAKRLANRLSNRRHVKSIGALHHDQMSIVDPKQEQLRHDLSGCGAMLSHHSDLLGHATAFRTPVQTSVYSPVAHLISFSIQAVEVAQACDSYSDLPRAGKAFIAYAEAIAHTSYEDQRRAMSSSDENGHHPPTLVDAFHAYQAAAMRACAARLEV